MAKWNAMDPRVKLVSISEGADFEIDLSGFDDPSPAFAFVADQPGVKILHGLVEDGRLEIPDRPRFMWLGEGSRDCVLLRPTTDGTRSKRVSFRALSVGEFCVEIYFVRSDGTVELVHQNDFCFK